MSIFEEYEACKENFGTYLFLSFPRKSQILCLSFCFPSQQTPSENKTTLWASCLLYILKSQSSRYDGYPDRRLSIPPQKHIFWVVFRNVTSRRFYPWVHNICFHTCKKKNQKMSILLDEQKQLLSPFQLPSILKISSWGQIHTGKILSR